MNGDEFLTHALRVINNMKERIPPHGIELIDIPLSGGELTYAIEDLVGLIIECNIVVTVTEREQLCELIKYMKQDSDIVDQFRTQPETPTEVGL